MPYSSHNTNHSRRPEPERRGLIAPGDAQKATVNVLTCDAFPLLMPTKVDGKSTKPGAKFIEICRKLAMALTGASQYYNARRTLWLWKGAAVALLGEKLADNPPPMEKHAERPAKHQHVPDGVANRFVPWLTG